MSRSSRPQNIPIDYSAPNVAKEMHVGHLRTTVVGDSIARTLEHLGHNVIRQNHIGDWGTPFGMLIEHLLDVGEGSDEADLLVTDPNAFYQAARVKFDPAEKAEPAGSAGDFNVRARTRVVLLQAGDPETLALWQRARRPLEGLLQQDLLDPRRHADRPDTSPASRSTTTRSPASASELEAGASRRCPTAPCASSSTATPAARASRAAHHPQVRRRIRLCHNGSRDHQATACTTSSAHRVLYVIGAPQSLHLNMVWDTARKAGWLPDDVVPVHVQIGNVLGEDRKILKTRSGAPLRLMALLDEAIERHAPSSTRRGPTSTTTLRATIARQIGIGAVKYADLSVAHDSEYVFDLDRMVALTGNTGPYLQYVVARIRSIFRQVGLDPAAQHAPISSASRTSAPSRTHLLGFGDVVRRGRRHLRAAPAGGYLFELAQAFSAFYENCPVLKAERDEVRESRLTLCALVFRVMTTGLDLLGLESPEQM